MVNCGTRKLELDWFGHFERTNNSRLVIRVVEARQTHENNKGRPRKTCLNRIRETETKRARIYKDWQKIKKSGRN